MIYGKKMNHMTPNNTHILPNNESSFRLFLRAWLLFWKAVLKNIVDFLTLLIGTEGARLLREYGAGETPQAPKAPRRLPGTPAESERLEWKSTAKFKTAFWKNYF
jgi:hypothetical protein